MTLLAIDPGRSYKGEKTIGYALFHGDGRAIERGSISFEELALRLNLDSPDQVWDSASTYLMFDNWEIDEVVVEDFVNNDRSKGGQRNGTSECIGAVEFACIKAEVPFTRQPPATLNPAKLHAGYVQKVKHLPHQDSAYLHGFEYLVAKGVLHPKGLADTL